MSFDPKYKAVTAFDVMMKPTGKGRPIVTKTGAFTPNKTRGAEQAVRDAWVAAGGVRCDEGPIGILVVAYFERPKGHFTAKGAMSKKGREEPFPTVHPDWDNIGKLIADALNGYAYRDDKAIVDGAVKKRWADGDDFPRVSVALFSMAFPEISDDPETGEVTVTFQRR